MTTAARRKALLLLGRLFASRGALAGRPEASEPDWNAVTWKFLHSCAGGEPAYLSPGIDAWQHRWIAVGDETGAQRIATVVDGIYRDTHRFHVWKIEAGGRTSFFAADEFSNAVWGFFIPVEAQASLTRR